MSTNFLTFLLWIGSLIVNIIGWAIVAQRSSNAELIKRLDRLEKSRDKLVGWVQGKFQVDLNGD